MDLHVGDLLCQGSYGGGQPSEVMISREECIVENGYNGYEMIVIRGYFNPNRIGELDNDWTIYDDCMTVIERPTT